MQFPISYTALLLAYAIVIVGSTIQGSIGFGLGSFSVPLLILVDPIFVPGPLLCMATMLTIMVYRRERASVEAGEIKWGILGRILGTVLATILLSRMPQELTTPVIAAIVLLALVFIVGGFRVRLSVPNLVGVATLSGFMGTVASIGGPPLAILYYDKTGPRIRGTLSGIFFAGTIIALTGLAWIGRFGIDEIVLAVSLAPALALGFYLSSFGAKFLDRGYTKAAIVAVSGLAALFVIAKHVV